MVRVWALPDRGGVSKVLPGWVKALFYPRPNGKFLVLFCPNVMASIRKEKIGSEKIALGACLAERGWGAKAIWAMPIYTDHISKGGSPNA